MIPEISEFSYGFALTNELVGWSALRAAPVFPSLIEEGRTGGGYDVRLDRPGVPLFLQFKRAECMTKSNAREIQKGARLYTPFYRFSIMDAAISDQHRLLRQLDNGVNEVYYAAPRFHKISEINAAWTTNSVASRSIFVSPNAIGRLSAGAHSISYDGRRIYRCSEPTEIESLNSGGLLEKLKTQLEQVDQPLGDSLSAMIDSTMAIAESEHAIEQEDSLEIDESASAAGRTSRILSPDEQRLRKLSDLAAKVFGTQLIIVQPANDHTE